ncbi:MAG TPA: hypothetical protein VJ746_18660 [Nitrospira sp.]|nr:hypothetical protein [Nitrospira sp.]
MRGLAAAAFLFLTFTVQSWSFQSGAAGDERLSKEHQTVVPVEDYPLYDLIVTGKFLTSETRLVVVDRFTLIRIHPEQQGPLHAETFRPGDLFDGRVSRELVRDFVDKSRIPSRLEARFDFGVPYRLIAGDQDERQETSLIRIPVSLATPVQEPGEGPAPNIHVGFSRVAFDGDRREALIYVEYDRFDGGQAGFMVWLIRSGAQWGIADTEVLWAARPVAPGQP